MPDQAFDFLSFCKPGMVLRTRDRRAATILAVAPDSGIITGEVPMLGRCEWRADGRYRGAPAGAAGPWDLMPPAATERDVRQTHARLADALDEPNPGCCD